MRKRVLVGFSGGVDSAVSAYLLKQQGYEVVLAFMRNWDSLTNQDILGNPTIDDPQCTQEVDYADAMQTARVLGLPLERVDFIEEYWQDVFTTFLAETRANRTPNPDILCNRFIKFSAFDDYRKKLGLEYLATGHYARNVLTDHGYRMFKAVDGNKDQTYFLDQVRPEVLDHVLFPLGELTKPEVRAIADSLQLPVAKKKDSTGICFIGERQYRLFLSNYLKDTAGEIIDVANGMVVGTHPGVMYYTIGQRHGLAISHAMGPWFVVGKSVATHRLYVCRKQDRLWLKADQVLVDRVNWFAPEYMEGEMQVKFRYRQQDHPVRVQKDENGQLRVQCLDPIYGVSEGQEAVFYRDGMMLGGGRIIDVQRDGHSLMYYLKEAGYEKLDDRQTG